MSKHRQPRITIGTACYNDGVHIREMWQAIDENEPVGLIICDDGSTDEASIAALRELEAKPDVQVIWQENRGAAAAFHASLAAAQTDYVFLLGGDDLPARGALGELADLLEANPQADFAYGDHITFGEHQRLISSLEWDPWLATVGNYCSAMLMMRRSLLEELPYPADRSTLFEDWDYLMTLAESGKQGIRLDRVAFFYRRHGEGRRARRGLRAYRKEFNKLRAKHPRLFAQRKELARQSRYSAVMRFQLRLVLWLRCWCPPVLVNTLAALNSRLSDQRLRQQMAYAPPAARR